MLDLGHRDLGDVSASGLPPEPTVEELDALLASMPAGIDTDWSDLPAGIVLAAGFAGLDFENLAGDARVEAIAAIQRLIAHYQALLYEGVASVYRYLDADLGDDMALTHEATAAEIRAELRLTRAAADRTVDLAMVLGERLPALAEALEAGAVDLTRVTTIVRGTEHLPPEVARDVVDRILVDAPTLTTGQIAARLRRLCIEADPEEADARLEAAHSERRVELRPDPAGTGHLFAFDLDPVRAEQAVDKVNRLARSLKTKSESRTIDQLRADVFLDLLIGGHIGSDAGPTASTTTHITVDLETLIGLADRPAELAGFGPVVADLARRAAVESRRWEFSVRDGDTGDLVAVGTTRRRPPAALRRAVRTTAPTCVFPGCRMPAVACDLDHTEAWAEGGATNADNLAPVCRHDHGVKHRHGWTYRRLSDGSHEWTSRLGRRHTSRPP